ncbi:hypothetical protein ACLOJK_009742 [Asimina triloba]
MGSETKTAKRLNPNWAQLQQILKSKLPKPSQPSIPDYSRKIVDTSLDAIAMDCEMVGVSSEGNKSAIGRVTLVNAWGNVLYDEYVRPLEHVVDFRTKISGIRPHHLRKAKDFQTAQKKVAELTKGRILVGHSLRNDLKALFLSHPKKDTRDTSEYPPFLKEGRRPALRVLAARLLSVEIQQKEHCPIEDARAAMMIYQMHKKEWEKSLKTRARIKEKLKSHKWRRKSKQKDALQHDQEAV